MSTAEHVDPRTRRTRDALARAMAETVLTAPLAEVSVAGLCRAAGVHRTTFYKHFRTVTELADAVLGDLFDQIDALGPLSDRGRFEDLLAHAAARRRTYAALIGPDGDPALSRAVAERLVAAVGRVPAASERDGAVGVGTTARVSGFAAYGAVEAVLLGAEPAAAARACEPILASIEVLPAR